MDKNMIIGAVLGAAVASTGLIGVDALESADAASRAYRAPVTFQLNEGESKMLQTLMSAHTPAGCTWMSMRIEPTTPPTVRAECKITPKSIDEVPAGAVIEVNP